jgi:RND family efflux transporter MFP subunit
MTRALQKAIVPVVLLALGAAGFNALLSLKADADRSATEAPPLPVEVVEAVPGSHPVRIEATGAVQASSTVGLVAEVPGRIVELAPGLTPGMRFAKGDTIARIDARDYRAQVVQAEAGVAGSQLELQLEEQRGAQAVREWELLGKEGSNPLALREPQLVAAQARLESSKAQLTLARLSLERTRLVAPFDGIVQSESLEYGQYVAPGSPVVQFMGTDRFRVRVSLPVDDLSLIQVPGFSGDESSEAIVTQRLADGTRLEKRGHVMRLLGELDPESRTATVLVAIDNPLDSEAGTLPILPGAYVDVAILAAEIDDVVALPREAVVEGNKAWVADREDRLAKRELQIAWAGRLNTYISGGFEDGDRVITSPLSLPIIGQTLDVRRKVAAAQ